MVKRFALVAIVMGFLAMLLAVFGELVTLNIQAKDYDGNSIEGVDVTCRSQKAPSGPYATSRHKKYGVFLYI